jgi:hypothetical protein
MMARRKAITQEPAMAEENQVASAEPEVPSAEPSAVVVSDEPVLEFVTVRAKRNRYYNPFTKVYFHENEIVEDALLDGWLQSQLDAGYIERV